MINKRINEQIEIIIWHVWWGHKNKEMYECIYQCSKNVHLLSPKMKGQKEMLPGNCD